MKLVVNVFILLTILIGAFQALAEEPISNDNLPIGLTEEEMGRLDEIGINHIRTAPPPWPIRNPAEWEPSVGVIIRWPLGISIDLVAELSEDMVVTTIVASTSYQSQAIAAYTSGGVNMANTDFLIASTNSIWTRDYGPWFIFDGNDELAIVDHIYNRPRPLDDQIPWILGSDWGMDVFGMDLIATGGNHMSDGLGISMSTVLTYNENTSLTHNEVDSIIYAFLNNDFVTLDYIESGGIHHIDCWAKFLDPATILIKDVSPSDYSYSLLNDRAEYLSQQMSSWGRPYDIVRVYCPSGAAYTNSLILGRKVFVPILGYSNWDDSAIAVYKEAMPGYEVLGFTGSFYDDDAIHCRTMGVPDPEMLYIHHVPLYNVTDTLDDYLITATIKDYSNAGLIPDSLKIFYRTKTPNFLWTQLYPTANPDSFYGYIPAQSDGVTVNYYLQAADSSGRVETHPFIGASWAHTFTVDFNQPPAIITDDTLFCETQNTFGYYPGIDDDDTVHTITYSDYPLWMNVQNDSLIGTGPVDRVLDSFMVRVDDGNNYDETEVFVLVYLCGDANGDGALNIFDVTWLISYLYLEGEAPYPLQSGDINSVDSINIFDITGMIDFLYRDGPDPDCP
jgi:agmatine deiminase